MIIELTACEEFHGLRARPFSLTPDLRFTYHSTSHTHALEQISQALKRREGLMVVTGEVGTGKTMLCRALLDTFETRTFLSVVLDPLLTVEDLLHQVLTDFGLLSARDRGLPPLPLTEIARHDMVAVLQRFLASLIPLNAHAVIIIDEAQHLTGPVLEQVRLLSNFETDSAKLLQIVLVGQPNLDLLLQRPDMQQLNQRVARRCELEPLTEAEVGDYIERRLLVASEDPSAKDARDLDLSQGGAMVHFAPAATALVAQISRGIPRLVNTLSDRALEGAFEAGSHVVDRKAVLRAAEHLRLPVPATRWSGRTRAAIIAALLLLAILGGWWWTRARVTPPAPAPSVTPATPAAAVEPGPSIVTPPEAAVAADRATGTATSPAETTTASPAAPPDGLAPSAPPVPPVPSVTSPAPTATDAARFEITAASFKTEERAAAVTSTLTQAGLPAVSRADASGQWYRVVVGPFDSKESALDAQQQLDGLGFKGTRIYTR
ncbi:MAG: AAA family ATPase [Vicinamibacterales bacterium]